MLRLSRFLLRRTFRRPYSKKVVSEEHEFAKGDAPTSVSTLLPLPKYGGESIVTLITGAGFFGIQGGKFIRSLISHANVPVAFENISVDPHGEGMLDKELMVSFMRNRVAIHVDLQHDPRDKANILKLNSKMDLFACISKMQSIPGYNCRHPDLDIMMIVQNNAGDYSKLEYEVVDGVVETLSISGVDRVRRFMKFVFHNAKKHGRSKITFGHKAAEVPLTDGRFLDMACEVRSKGYPEIEIEFKPINNLVREIVMTPEHFDVICANERYGTMLMAVCAAVCGGASLFSTIEMGDHHSIFKPMQTRLSLTDSKELSPYGIVRACVDLLAYLGNTECAHELWKQLHHTMVTCDCRTHEFGGERSGGFVICHIADNLKCKFA